MKSKSSIHGMPLRSRSLKSGLPLKATATSHTFARMRTG